MNVEDFEFLKIETINEDKLDQTDKWILSKLNIVIEDVEKSKKKLILSNKKELFKYILSRLGLLPIMLWIISSLVFILLRIAPGDPVDAILGTRANEFARESLRVKLGLNKPLINQYLEYLNHLIHHYMDHYL